MVIKTIDFFFRTNIMYCQSIFQHTVLYKISRANKYPGYCRINFTATLSFIRISSDRAGYNIHVLQLLSHPS